MPIAEGTEYQFKKCLFPEKQDLVKVKKPSSITLFFNPLRWTFSRRSAHLWHHETNQNIPQQLSNNWIISILGSDLIVIVCLAGWLLCLELCEVGTETHICCFIGYDFVSAAGTTLISAGLQSSSRNLIIRCQVSGWWGTTSLIKQKNNVLSPRSRESR